MPQVDWKKPAILVPPLVHGHHDPPAVIRYVQNKEPELWFGLTRRLMQAPSSKRLLEIQSRLEQWSKDLNIVSFDGKAAGAAARFNSTLVQQGRILQQPDMFIAAQAIANNLVLVSHDHRAFEGLQKEGLLWEDWCAR